MFGGAAGSQSHPLGKNECLSTTWEDKRNLDIKKSVKLNLAT